MKKTKIRARDLPLDTLPYDFERRLKNAMLVLATLDAQWIIWIEKNIPAHTVDRHHLQLIEIRARALAIRGYRTIFSEGQQIGIVFSEMPFNDRGALQQI